jgi:hypothetical protein
MQDGQERLRQGFDAKPFTFRPCTNFERPSSTNAVPQRDPSQLAAI